VKLCRSACWLTLVIGLVLIVAACAAPPDGQGPVTLVLKHAKILGPVDPIPRLLAQFEAEHPGIRVKAEVLPWTSDEQRQFLVINLEGGRPGFDVMMLDCIWVPEFARAGWLLDMTPRLGRDELADNFPAAVEAGTWDQRTWALPWFMNVGLLYYRADLLRRYHFDPPATHAEMLEQIRVIRAGERNSKLEGYLWQGKQYEGLVVNVLEGLWAAGTSLLDEHDRVFPDAGRAEAVLRELRQLIDTGASPAWVTAADEESTRRPFGNGEAIFLRSWPYAADLFERSGSPVQGKVGLAPLPRDDPRRPAPGSTGGAHLAVTRQTRHPAEAFALARFLTSAPAQRAMTASGATKPTIMSLYHDPELVRLSPSLPRIHDLTLAGRSRPVTPYYVMISTTLQPELSAALVGVKTPERSVVDSRRRLDFFLRGLRE